MTSPNNLDKERKKIAELGALFLNQSNDPEADSLSGRVEFKKPDTDLELLRVNLIEMPEFAALPNLLPDIEAKDETEEARSWECYFKIAWITPPVKVKQPLRRQTSRAVKREKKRTQKIAAKNATGLSVTVAYLDPGAEKYGEYKGRLAIAGFMRFSRDKSTAE